MPLTVTEHLLPAYDGCGTPTFDTFFLRPERALEPNTTYTFDAGGESSAVTSFTTGDGRFVSESTIEANLRYLYVQPDCSGEHCFHLAKVRVDIDSEAMRWVVIESAAEQDDRNAATLHSENVEPGAGFDLSVVLPPDDRCVDVRVYGVEGTVLFEERRCDPDRCAVADLIFVSTCGGPPISVVDIERIPDGSCDDPPEVEWSPDGGLVYPDEEPAAGMGDNASSASCSVGRPQRITCSIWLLALAALLLRRRPAVLPMTARPAAVGVLAFCVAMRSACAQSEPQHDPGESSTNGLMPADRFAQRS